MSDIVERLREGLYDQDIPTMLGPLLDEAADEIVRLRQRVTDLEGQHKGLVITNGILRQRPDLPVDRLPVMREVEAMREALRQIDDSRNENEFWIGFKMLAEMQVKKLRRLQNIARAALKGDSDE